MGFRWFTRSEALGLGLSGWARNRKSGDVEVLVNGSEKDLETMENSLKKGPPASMVDSVSGSEDTTNESSLGFEIRPTA